MKGANLAKMMLQGLPIPEGVIITVSAFEQFFGAELRNWSRSSDPTAVPVASRRFVFGKDLDAKLIDQLTTAVLALGFPVAVRSSSTLEDMSTQSFAGIYHTQLNVTNKTDLLHAIKECYASQFGAKALLYQASDRMLAANPFRGKMAIIIQKMVPAELAGVMFTEDPVTGASEHIVIEYVEGLGDRLVDGIETPRRHTIARSLEDCEFPFSSAPAASAIDSAGITNSLRQELATYVNSLEKIFDGPLDIEWAFDRSRVYILQCRPLTAIFRPLYPQVEWRWMFAREYGVQYTEISLRSLTHESGGATPYEFFEQAYVPDPAGEACIFGATSHERLVAACQRYTEPESFLEYEAAFHQAASDYIEYARVLTERDLSMVSPESLVELYLGYQRYAIRYCAFIWTSFLVNEMLGAHAGLLFEQLTRPIGNAAIFQLEEAALKLDEDDPAAIAELHRQFRWKACLDIHNPPISLNDFRDEALSFRAQRSVTKVHAEDKVIRPLSNKKLIEHFEMVRRCAYLKDLRDDYRRQAVYLAQEGLFQEIAARTNASLQELSYCLEREIVDLIRGGALPVEVHDRVYGNTNGATLRGFVLYFDEEREIQCASGDQIPDVLIRLGYTKPLTDNGHTGPGADDPVLGRIACRGRIEGTAAVVNCVADLSKVSSGSILIASTTNTDYLGAILKASAIVTDTGGETCHAAIIARRCGLPCVVGTRTHDPKNRAATQFFKDGDIISVEALDDGIGRISLLERRS